MIYFGSGSEAPVWYGREGTVGQCSFITVTRKQREREKMSAVAGFLLCLLLFSLGPVYSMELHKQGGPKLILSGDKAHRTNRCFTNLGTSHSNQIDKQN